MKCHEVQSKIAQIDDDSPAAEIIVHARECAACHQSLREVLWQQKWLRERFSEVSEQLLAHAPPLWGAAFQERLKGPALPAPLLPVAWAAVLLGAAALGWWTWTTSTTSSSKSSFAERHAPRESAERPTASANRLDRRRRPLGRQRPGLCGHCLNRARRRTLRQNWPSRSLYRSLTYRSHHRSQPWLKHRQRLRCRSRRHLPSFVSTQVCFKWNRLPSRQAPKVTWLRSFRRTAPIKRPPWWR